MDAKALQHAAYLGTLLVSDRLCRQDLMVHRDGSFWIRQVITTPDGTMHIGADKLVAAEKKEAIEEAYDTSLLSLTEMNLDMSNVHVLHWAPGIKVQAQKNVEAERKAQELPLH